MTYVSADISINGDDLSSIDTEVLSNELIGTDGEVEIRLDLNGGETVYVCARPECNVPVNGDGDPDDQSNDRCEGHPDVDGVHQCGIDCDAPAPDESAQCAPGCPNAADECDGLECWPNQGNGCGQNGEPKPAPHLATVAPLGWVHYVDVTSKPTQDEVVVRINTVKADPFVIYVSRYESKDDDGREYTEYRLQVPHPEQTSRWNLTPLSGDGVYRIGEREYHD